MPEPRQILADIEARDQRDQRALMHLSVTAAWHWVAAREGAGYDPRDAGGRTSWGVSERAHPEAWADGRVSYAEAEALFERNYWARLRCGDMPGALALVVVDAAYNCGVNAGARWLQASLNNCLVERRAAVACVTVDGVVGVQTMGALTAWVNEAPYAHTMGLVLRYNEWRRCHYHSLAAMSERHRWSYRGWLNRTDELTAAATTMLRQEG